MEYICDCGLLKSPTIVWFSCFSLYCTLPSIISSFSLVCKLAGQCRVCARPAGLRITLTACILEMGILRSFSLYMF